MQRCGQEWGVRINWLEWRPGPSFEVVNHNNASRQGEPFKMLIDSRGYLPNPVTRYCTAELKVKTTERFLKREVGWKEWISIVGLRADEPDRVRRVHARNDVTKDCWDTDTPLSAAGVTKEMVGQWWRQQHFDLGLPNEGGVTPFGNCDLCFMKGVKTLRRVISARPDLLPWWAEAEAEAEARASKPEGARFRVDRPRYADLPKYNEVHEKLRQEVYGDQDPDLPCGCTD